MPGAPARAFAERQDLPSAELIQTAAAPPATGTNFQLCAGGVAPGPST
eukprot:COSAG06_NODE_3873_length_4814_cov_3.323648_1_plen_48_part_00